ncbi:FAD-dependent oxidoreductase [Photobacterium sp. SDRW27]|uniref:NAD(P)/FAD-dependent oxidoreductase n=1 Tax=Photobacterium obscurum TaxID=2829490 RepID=UPI0022431267|nr:FAD-dependent oxidoreductase [Photobacterium obscurum]MCW8329357.1 FAD-dependent oxidoreductase [Photobacterium obscurum]
MKIAIIGSGISGLTCAWHLHRQHDITVYEANSYIGGHTATVDVSVPSGDYAIDTGFIVFNDRTYPNFERLLAEIDISGQKTEMSFSVQNDVNGLEYNGHSLSTMFAQTRNCVNPKFYYFVYEILRFNSLARNVDLTIEKHCTLGDFLHHYKFSHYFTENYILPMGAAIWSSTLSDMRSFPLDFFIRFFRNHGLLEVVNRPQWYVIPGGSREYVKKLIIPFEHKIRLNHPVSKVTRQSEKVLVESATGLEVFDQVIFASHSDQSLSMLADASADEQRILGEMEYQDNEVVLHTDTRMLPKTRAAWAAWNYHLGPECENGQHRDNQLASLTYNMNILQGISAPETFCVTLNRTENIAPEKIIKRFVYAHPVFSTTSVLAQQARGDINGKQNTWFCGAYWYNGFHEDGVRSALDVVEGIEKLTIGGLVGSAEPAIACRIQERKYE